MIVEVFEATSEYDPSVKMKLIALQYSPQTSPSTEQAMRKAGALFDTSIDGMSEDMKRNIATHNSFIRTAVLQLHWDGTVL